MNTWRMRGWAASQPVVRSVPGLADANGDVPVRDTSQSVPSQHLRGGDRRRGHGALDHGRAGRVPKAGFPTEAQAHVAADNIAAQIRGQEPAAHKEFGDIPRCV
jgi:hypothetical protein